jgi:hypothetical protein
VNAVGKPGGAVFIETFPPEARQRIERQVEELGDGWRFPMPPTEELANMASLEGVDDDHLRLLGSRAVAQPFGTYTQPLRLENPAREELPKLGILCGFSLDQVQEMIAGDNPLFRGLAGPEGASWSYPRDTGPCSPGLRTLPSCSSSFHRTRLVGRLPLIDQLAAAYLSSTKQSSEGSWPP